MARHSASKYNLKDIGDAVYDHDDDRGTLPRGITDGSDLEPLHGWHVTLLPYLGHEVLHEQIDLEKPWDNAANAKAFRTIVPQFRNGQIEQEFDDEGRADSHYAANVLVVSGREPMVFRDVTDGLGNTLFVGEVNDEFRAWGHPYSFRDPRLGLNKVPHGFGGPWHETPVGERTQMLLGDGSVRSLDNDVDPAVLNALSTPAGGEPRELHQVP